MSFCSNLLNWSIILRCGDLILLFTPKLWIKFFNHNCIVGHIVLLNENKLTSDDCHYIGKD